MQHPYNILPPLLPYENNHHSPSRISHRCLQTAYLRTAPSTERTTSPIETSCPNITPLEEYVHHYTFSPDGTHCILLQIAEKQTDAFLPHFLPISKSPIYGGDYHEKLKLFILSDPINRHDMNRQDFNLIRGSDFINTLDNALLFW